MSRRYFLYSTNSDLTVATATYNKYFLPNLIGGASSSIQSISIAAAGNLTASCFTYQLHPGNHAQTGSYTASLEISTANAQLFLSTRFHRINSAGTIQSSSITSAEQAIGSAIAYAFTSSLSLGTFASSDRIRVDYMFRNNAAHSTQAGAFLYNQTGSFVLIAAVNRKMAFS